MQAMWLPTTTSTIVRILMIIVRWKNIIDTSRNETRKRKKKIRKIKAKSRKIKNLKRIRTDRTHCRKQLVMKTHIQRDDW